MSGPVRVGRERLKVRVELAAWAQGALAMLVPALQSMDPESERPRAELLLGACRAIVDAGTVVVR